MGKKYKMTSETKILANGIVLHQIKALKDFSNVKKGDLGGFIEKEENLSQEGNCWVYDDAKVFGDALVDAQAKVFGDTTVYGHARVFDMARIFGKATVYGHARVFDNATVSGYAEVYNHAKVYGHAEVCAYARVFGYADVYKFATILGNANIHESAIVSGNATVAGDADVYGCVNIKESVILHKSAKVSSVNDILYVGPIGSRDDYTTFYKGKDGGIMVNCGCFNDTIDKFEEQVKVSHRNREKYLDEYLAAISFAKVKLL